MSKDKATFEIMGELGALTMEQNQQILSCFRKSKKKNNKIALTNKDMPIKHYDRDRNKLAAGDRIRLLKKGLDNNKGEEGRVKALPP